MIDLSASEKAAALSEDACQGGCLFGTKRRPPPGAFVDDFSAFCTRQLQIIHPMSHSFSRSQGNWDFHLLMCEWGAIQNC